MTNTPTNSNADELQKTKAKVLYILKTHLTIAEDDDPDEVYASMIARHIHDNFELKANVVEAIGEDEPMPPEYKGDPHVLTPDLLDHYVENAQFDYRYWGGYNRRGAEIRRKLGLESE